MEEFADYAWLVSDAAAKWLAAASADERPALAVITTLRKDLPSERARLVVEQAELRRRGAEKFGELAAQMFFTRTLLEQATDAWIAGYKEARLRQAAGDSSVHDVCCGVGGDLFALACGGPAIGYDRSPIACLLAEANLAVVLGDRSAAVGRVRQIDAERLDLPASEVWHLDPDRRATGRRTTTAEEFSPGPEVVSRWLSGNPAGAVKLAPASEAPAAWVDGVEREWISCRRECRQQVIWFGRLATAPNERRATLVEPDDGRGSVAGSFVGKPNAACDIADAVGEYVFDADPSVHAARLLSAAAAQFGLATLGVGGGYLTGDQAAPTPLLTAFRVEECLPLRTAPLAEALAARGIGRLEIKKRGVDADPQRLRRDLKIRGDEEATLILTRIGAKEFAVLARRVALPAEG